MNHLMYKVRFHLGLGENYMKWQVTHPCGNKQYFDPQHTNLELINCKLKNRKSVANKIFKGENKTVCAWIECEKFNAWPEILCVEDKKQIQYNPKKAPFWTDASKKDIDDRKYEVILSKGQKLFA